MAALTTGLPQHRDYAGSVEQSSGLAPEEDQVFTAAEINAIIAGIDDHAPLIDGIKAITDALPAFDDNAVDAGSYWSAAKTVAELTIVSDALTAVTTVDDDGYDTLQEIVDKLKQAETDIAAHQQQGVGPTIYLSADAELTSPAEPYHTQPYVIDSSGTATGTDGDGDYVSYTVEAVSSANKRIWVTRSGDKNIRIVGLIDGEAEGVIHNLNGARLELDSGDGLSDWSLHYNGEVALTTSVQQLLQANIDAVDTLADQGIADAATAQAAADAAQADATTGVADAATALARANHTGTQLLSTISDAGALAALSTVGTDKVIGLDAKIATYDGEPALRDAAIAAAVEDQSTLAVSVGAGGDYATINLALAYLANKNRGFKSTGPIPATITILTGTTISEQVFVEDQDLSWITIESDDAEVPIARSALTVLSASYYPAFMASNARLPVINCLFSMDTSGTATNRVGIQLKTGAFALVRGGAGIKNCAERGMHLIDSKISANGSVWDGSGIGLRCGNLSTAYVRNSSFLNCTNSVMNVAGASTVLAQDIVSTGSVTGIVAENGCTIFADNFNLINCPGIVISADSGAKVIARGMVATGCTAGITIRAENTSIVDISQNDASTASNVSGNTGGVAIYASQGSTVNADGINASGALTYGIDALTGASVNANNADVSSAGTFGIRVFRGGFINARGLTGTKNQTVNTITSDGIIIGT